MKRINLRSIAIKLCAFSIAAVSAQANASGFQLWEQDAASIGNFHAGYAAKAEDASTAFYNPAGLSRLDHKQVIFGATAIAPSFKYKGNVSLNVINNFELLPTVAQGGVFKTVPMFHYAAPINDRIGFGLSIVVPFGLATNYGQSTPMRYAATESSVFVVDTSPVISYKVTKDLSVGAGPDFQYMQGEFDQIGTYSGKRYDSDGVNKATGTAWGYHAGLLYQLNKDARVGLSYHSQVVHHLSGTSDFTGPLADDLAGGPIYSNRASVDVTLPPYTALSAYYHVRPKLALMGSVIYTQWSTIQNLILKNVSGINADGERSTDITAVLPENFKNSYNVSLGADYFLSDDITLRTGIGYDQTPTSDAYRNARLPDNNRYVIALGGHYQATKTVGFDVSWAHFFIKEAVVNPPKQTTGLEEINLDGKVKGGADVLSGQIVWNIN